MIAVKSTIKQIVNRILFLLMGAQIVLGALWFCANFTAGQFFAETEEMLEISKTWVLDEYVGILYPMCVWITRGIEGMIGVPYQFFLYIAQLASVFAASVFFLDKSGLVKRNEEGKKNRKIYFGAAYVCSVPMIMQFQVAVVPYSFVLAVFLVVLGECIFLCKNKGLEKKELWRNLAVIALGWLLGGFLLPEYVWLAALPVGLSFLICMCRNKKIYSGMLVVFATVLLLYHVAAGVYQEPGSLDRMQKSVSATLLRRVVWPNFQKNQYFWDTYGINIFTTDELYLISGDPELVLYMFGPGIEETFGKTRADEIYMFMTKISWEMRTKEVVTAIVKDAVSYVCPQIAVAGQLRGEGASYSGWNYNLMSDKTPVLTKYYVNTSLYGFLIVLAMEIIVCVARVIGKRRKFGVCEKIFLAVTVLEISVWYTMTGAGLWNYRNALVICALWAAVVASVWTQEEKMNEED